MHLDKESVQDNGSQYSDKQIHSNKFEPNNGYAMTITTSNNSEKYQHYKRGLHPCGDDGLLA